MNKELLIISGLLHSSEFKQRTLPYIEKEYFESESCKLVFDVIKTYESQYKQVPNKSAFDVEMQSLTGVSEAVYRDAEKAGEKVFSDTVCEHIQKAPIKWLVETTEEYCLQRSVYNAVLKSVEVIGGEDKNTPKEALPNLLQEALNVSFDHSIGHDYIEDYEKRYEYYHLKENKISFPLSVLNKTTKGGLPKKAIGVFIAPTGVGKTLALTYCASHYLMQGKNVLYITLEMAEERIGERIDAALFDCTLDGLKDYAKPLFEKKVQSIKGKTTGNLIIKEYPTGSISSQNIDALIDELKTKKDFVPDVILVDYLGLMKSVRMKYSENSYNYVKSVTEELRAVAVEREVLVLTAHQTNRAAQGASDFDLTNVSDSAGISHTADWMCGIISTEELETLEQLRFKQLKNRFGPLYPSSFIVGVNRAKMQLYDIDTGDDFESSKQQPNTSQSSTIEDMSKKANNFNFD